jgi:hypothetical protein
MPDTGDSQQPAAEQKASTELPEWAKPYAKDILAKGQALTDVNQNPYQTYGQERIAGFSPMQQQAMQNAQGMTVAPQTGEATAGATMAGMGGLGVAGQANPYGFQSQVGGYMNPYLQMSLAPQLAEANRMYDIGATKQQSAATQAGAFGGSREAIMAAENERNRNMGLNSIIGQGYNQAFGQAQNQYNQNLQNQLAGFGLTNQAAANLGQLGQNQYGQQMGINQLQNQYGGQQQAQMQRGLDTSYQDFLNQQNYPYKQLGFMSDMIRGLPLGQQSTTQMYQAPPTALQTAGSLALTGYGINQLNKADGGSVYGYADGGEIKYYAGHDESVTSSDNTEDIIGTLSLQQLQDAFKSAQARGDKQTAMLIAQQIEKVQGRETNKAIQNGIAGAMPQQMADDVVQAAGGGILAFAGDEEENDSTSGQLVGGLGALLPSRGNPTQYAALTNIYPQLLANVAGQKPKYMTDDQYDARTKKELALYREAAGPSSYGNIGDLVTKLGEQGKENLSQGKGLSALRAARGLLKGNNFWRGVGEASGEFADAYAPILKADQDLQRSMIGMRINLADAERKENIGAFTQARTAADAARRSKDTAEAARGKKAMDVANLAARMASTVKPTGTGGAGGAGKEPKFNEAALKFNIEDMLNREKPKEGESPKAFEARIKAAAVAKTATQIKNDSQLKAAVDTFRTSSTSDTEVEKVVKSSKFSDPDWTRAYENGDTQGMARAEDALAANIRSRQTATNPTKPGSGGGGSNIIKIPD